MHGWTAETKGRGPYVRYWWRLLRGLHFSCVKCLPQNVSEVIFPSTKSKSLEKNSESKKTKNFTSYVFLFRGRLAEDQ